MSRSWPIPTTCCGGADPKHIDVPELLRVLDFTPVPVAELRPTVRTLGAERIYLTPAAEFRLSQVELDGTGLRRSQSISFDMPGPQMLAVLGGTIEVRTAAGDSATVPAGSALWLAAGDPDVVVRAASSRATFCRVLVPVSPARRGGGRTGAGGTGVGYALARGAAWTGARCAPCAVGRFRRATAAVDDRPFIVDGHNGDHGSAGVVSTLKVWVAPILPDKHRRGRCVAGLADSSANSHSWKIVTRVSPEVERVRRRPPPAPAVRGGCSPVPD